MASSPSTKQRLFLALITLGAMLATEVFAASRAQFRYLSFVIRDRAPTIEEAKAFRSRAVTIETFVDQWLSSPEHKQRIERYFGDMFGVSAQHPAVDWAFVLTRDDESGVYYRRNDNGPCTQDQAVQHEAWWLEPGTTIPVCPSEVSTELRAIVDGENSPCTANRIWSQGCGCGPKLIGCIGIDQYYMLQANIRQEFAKRATFAYEEGGTWFDTFAGTYFYGDRLLYWKYLHSSKMALGGMLPNQEEVETVARLSVGQWERTPFANQDLRIGLVTSPGFLLQYNNFRTRVRALSENLLCQTIGAPLNTGNIEVFLNPDFEQEDLDHAKNEQCAQCHYPMDNLGSMLFGWNTLGEWDPTSDPMSQIGHAFGINGTGPKFLVNSFIERGPGFNECMARTAWEDFAGTSFDELTKTDQQSLINLASIGPQNLIRTLLRSTLLANLGIEGSVHETPTSDIPWENVAPIIEKSCGGSNCHAGNSFNTTYVNNQGNLKTRSSAVANRILSDGPNRMPPPNADQTLSQEDRDIILDFIGKKGEP